MTKFVRGDVVKVALPAGAAGKEESAQEGAPGSDQDDGQDTALVISPSDLEHDSGLLWIARVVVAPSDRWTGDVPIVDTAVAAVAPQSWVRTAWLATVPAASARRIGRISGPLLARVLGQVTGALARL